MLRTIFAVFACFVFIVSSVVLVNPKPVPSSEFWQVRQQVHLIKNNFNGNGSGVMIRPGLMLTAAHVAEQQSDMAPLFVNSKPVKVLKIDKKNDLALLEVQVGCPCATLASDKDYVDAVAINIGYPLNNLITSQVVSEGRIQGYIEPNRLATTIPAAPGNSGGGTFVLENGQWKLVGILVESASACQNPFFCTTTNFLTRSVSLNKIKDILK